MSYPGEKAAWDTIHSPLSSSLDKAEARAKLAEIDRIHEGNVRRGEQYRVRQGYCPTCGRGPGA